MALLTATSLVAYAVAAVALVAVAAGVERDAHRDRERSETQEVHDDD